MGSSNALYVLRLLLRQQNTFRDFKQLSTVALSQDIPIAATPSASIAKPTFSFLEAEDSEYTTASQSLSVQELEPHPIPWPTIFQHQPATKVKYCDPLHRLVSLGQYSDALRIYHELTNRTLLLDRKVYIQRRHIYLDPALAALENGDKEGFFLWLALYPNKPGTENRKKGLQDVWEPVMDLVVNYRSDKEFIDRFLSTTAKLGLLPMVLPRLLPWLAFSRTPASSRDLMEELTSTYQRYTTSPSSTSTRAETQRVVVRTQISKLWSTYLRKLILAGWISDAQTLFENPPSSVKWDDHTSLYYHARKDGSPSHLTLISSSTLPLPQQIREVLSPQSIPTPTYLASIISQLSSLSASYDALSGEFIEQFQKAHGSYGELIFLHAQILRLVGEGDHSAAVRLFGFRFEWLGLPWHPLKPSLQEKRDETTGESSGDRRIPSIHVITTLFPSLLSTVSEPTKANITEWYHSYLQQDFEAMPPALRPNQVTHAALLRHLAHFDNPNAARSALELLQQSSPELVGESAFSAVILSLAGRRQINNMWEVLDQMEAHDGVGAKEDTYKGLVGILAKTGKVVEAEQMVRRGVAKFGTGWVKEVKLD